MRSHADILDTIEWEAASREPDDAAEMFRDIAAYCTRRSSEQHGDYVLSEFDTAAS